MRLTGEQEFILSFLRISLGSRSPEEPAVGASAGNLDWDRVTSMAGYHGLSILLHDFLRKYPGVSTPAGVGRFLYDEFVNQSALSLFHEKALEEIVKIFRSNSIPFAVHKGLGLAALLYPDPGLRPAGGDLDIFVMKEEYPRARRLLAEMGYSPADSRLEDHGRLYIGEVNFLKTVAGRELVIDLHTDLIANVWGKVTGFDMEDFWDSLLEVECGSFVIPHLPVETALFFLCIHVSVNHIFDRLIIMCDLDLMVRKFGDEIDWDRIARYAVGNGAKKAMYFSLCYCKKLLGTPVPDYFLEAIRPGALSRKLIPERMLFFREDKPPKWLERYMHILLLDNPLHVLRTARIFTSRILAERELRKRGSGL
jgi:hypothetical protein